MIVLVLAMLEGVPIHWYTFLPEVVGVYVGARFALWTLRR